MNYKNSGCLDKEREAIWWEAYEGEETTKKGHKEENQDVPSDQENQGQVSMDHQPSLA